MIVRRQVGEKSEASGESNRPANGGGQGAEACDKGGDANATTLEAEAEVEARSRRTMEALVMMLVAGGKGGPGAWRFCAPRNGQYQE